jgi:hypothetical protein
MDPTARPPERLEVDVEAVAPRARSRRVRAPAVVLVAMVVVIAGSIGLSHAFPVDQRPEASRVAVASAAPSTRPESMSPSPAESAGAAPTLAARVDRQTLVTRVLDGSLEGWLVYADAEIRLDCPTGTGARCSALPPRIVGLPLRRPAGDTPDRRLEPVPAGAVMVLRVAGAGFDYEGALIADPDGSPTLSTLEAEVGAAQEPEAATTLRDASGWLVRAGPCLIPPSAFEPCPRQPFLAEVPPLATADPSTTAGEFVEVALGAWGINPPFDPILAGPFLVRRLQPVKGDGPAWEIVARYDPSRSVRVVIP